MPDLRHFEHELTAAEDIPRGTSVEFYAIPYRSDEVLYVGKLRPVFKERQAYIGVAALDLREGQKCCATFGNWCEVWPITEVQG